MLSIEEFKDLVAVAGERRLRIVQGGDPRLEPREAEVLLWLADHQAERGFDLLSGVAAVANDPVRLACRFAAGDVTKLVSVAPNRHGEGDDEADAVAPQPDFAGSRMSISRVSRPGDEFREA